MNRTVLHIDFDSFFASCEQQFHVQYRNKPLGVTATNGRTCIIAASREAKRYGIKTGTRSWEAFKLCPTLLLTPANFNNYWEISKKFLNICKDYAPFVELFSLDEVFMDVTGVLHLFGNEPLNIVQTVKSRIRHEIGEYITVSAGISHNKILAKMASGMKKPDGVFKISIEHIEHIYRTAQLTDICGIGERIKIRLNSIGVYTLWQLRQVPLRSLIAEFGPAEAGFLHQVGLGIDDSPVVSYTQKPEVKSVGRNYCLPHNTYDQRIILQNIFELCEEVGIKLRRLNRKARTVGLSLRGKRNGHGRVTSKMFIDSGTEIFKACKYLYDKWEWKEMVRQISVWSGNLGEAEFIQPSLFDAEKERNKKLIKTIDILNEKFGDHTIRNGFLLYADKLTTVPNGWGADRFERTSLANSIKY